MILNILIALLVVFLTVLAYFMWIFTHWTRLGVPGPVPSIPFGNKLPFPAHLSQVIAYFYTQFKNIGSPFFGIYLFLQPVAIITDMELAKNILIKDFASFQHRGLYTNEKDDPLTCTLVALEGEKWRKWRTKMSPTFTSGKMKFMYSTIIEVADKFQVCVSKMVQNQEQVEIKDLISRYATDVIGACAFGIECSSLDDPNCDFRRMVKVLFGQPHHSGLVAHLISAFPRVSRALGMKLLREDVSKFFINVVRETMKQRESENISRNDFMDLLVALKNQDTEPMTIEEITAQVFIFFIAGLDTTTIAMMYSLYELALNQEIQNKARDEIRTVLEKHDGHFTYEAMLEMTYIDQVLNESMRKYPPVTQLMRKATENYPVSGTNLVMPKGTLIFIPNFAIQNDPEIFPDPEKFNPDRFNADEKLKREKMHFLPFGDGPRNCIGARFGMMKARVGLVKLLMNYEFTKSPRTRVPIEFNVQGFVLLPYQGLHLNMRKL